MAFEGFEELEAMLRDREDLKATQEYIKKQLDEIEGKVKKIVGMNTVVEAGDFTVSYKEQARESIDTKRLKEEHPELAKQFRTCSVYPVLRVTNKRRKS